MASILWDDVLDLDHIPSSSSLQFLWRLFLRGQLEKLPQWIHSLRGLTRVILCSSEMEDDLLECLNNCPNCWALPNLDLPSRRIVFQGGLFSEAREIIFAEKQRNEMSEGKRRCHA